MKASKTAQRRMEMWLDQNLAQNSRIERICTDTMLGIKVGKN